MSLTTETIRDAACGSSRGSEKRWVADNFGGCRVSAGTGDEVRLRRYPQPGAKTQECREIGVPPASTRDSVMKLTSAASAALRIDRPADSRRSRRASANAPQLRNQTSGVSGSSSFGARPISADDAITAP